MIKSIEFLQEQLNDLSNDLKDTIKAEITNENQIDFTEGAEFPSRNEDLLITGIYKADNTYIIFEDGSGEIITEDLDQTTEDHQTLLTILENVVDSSNTTIQL